MSLADILPLIVRLNVSLSLGLALVLALRAVWRGAFGARATYGLWLLAPLIALAPFAPRPVAALGGITLPLSQAFDVPSQAVARFAAGSAPQADAISLTPILLGLWLVGAMLAATWLVIRQGRFARAAALGLAGPAVSGFFFPRLVTPADFERRFDADEQAMVLAHENVHLTRQDARVNGLIAFVQCLFWFNPVLHLAARALRMDQELACDAVVAARHPTARDRYAQAMLKTQLTSLSAPLVCSWPGGKDHPLTRRIAMLIRPLPSPRRRAVAAGALAALAAASGLTVWSLSAQASPSSGGVAVSMPAPGPGSLVPPPPAPGVDGDMPLLNIEQSGLFIRGHETTLTRLGVDLRRLSTADRPATDPVFVRANRDVTYARVMQVLNRLQAAGYVNINILSEDL